MIDPYTYIHTLTPKKLHDYTPCAPTQTMVQGETHESMSKYLSLMDGAELTLWESCTLALQLLDSVGEEEVTALIGQYLAMEYKVDEFGQFNISTWRAAQREQAEFGHIEEQIEKYQPIVNFCQMVTRPTRRVLDLIASCSDGDGGMLVILLAAAIIFATAPIWFIHFSADRVLKRLEAEQMTGAPIYSQMNVTRPPVKLTCHDRVECIASLTYTQNHCGSFEMHRQAWG